MAKPVCQLGMDHIPVNLLTDDMQRSSILGDCLKEKEGQHEQTRQAQDLHIKIKNCCFRSELDIVSSRRVRIIEILIL